MKRQIGKNLRRLAVTACAAMVVVGSFQTAFAENNIGLGDINGDTDALANSNTFQLFSTGDSLELVKTAWITSDGSPIISGSTVPTGTYVDFMIFVNNQSSVAINDVSIQDVLGPLFVYEADSIRVDNSVGDCAVAICDSTEEAAIYAAASAVLPTNSDAVDLADTSSFDGPGTTVNVGNESVANLQLNAAANSVLAVVFTVQVQ